MNSMKASTKQTSSNDASAIHKNTNHWHSKMITQRSTKKPPPRPPPPDFSKMKSKLTWNLNQHYEEVSLIDLTPPDSPQNSIANLKTTFGGSISSSYSSSTSSLASSKRSSDYESVPFNNNAWAETVPTSVSSQSVFYTDDARMSSRMPTIIRAQKKPVNKIPVKKDDSPPMPRIPPPSPPKDVELVTPYGIAIYDFPAVHFGDLSLQANDVVFLLRKVNSEWYFGRVDDREGIFPANFIDVQVPLLEDNYHVKALYEFRPQMSGDLALEPGQSVLILKRVSDDWLFGECNGLKGQFPANFVDRIPPGL